jgi:hypothetical protein
MTLFRLSCRLAFSRDPRQRWRQVGIITSSAVASLALLLGFSVVHLAQVSQGRVLARSPVVTSSADQAVLETSTRAIAVDRREHLGQVPVIWLQPRPGHEHEPRAIPPGLSALPGPGEGVLSPGLVTRGYSAEDFGLRRSEAGLGPRGAIGADGLVSASEGWIYARPAAGRTLGEGGNLLSIDRYDPSPRATGNRADQETVLEVPSVNSSGVGLCWLVVAPVLYLALGAARSLSSLRLQRSGTLFRLGIAPWRIRALLALETVALAAPGIAFGAGIWFVLGPRMTTVPMTGVRLLPGTLESPWPQAAAGLLALAALTALSGMVGPLEAGSRGVRRRTPHAAQLIPMVAAVVMMGASRLADPPSAPAAYLLFGGVILCVASFPLGLPVLAAATGRALAGSRRPARWLAGRRLTFDSVTLARPAAAVAALVLIAGAAFAIYGRVTAGGDDPSGSVRGRVAYVDWRDERPGDVSWARGRLSRLVTATTGEGRDGEPVAMVDECSAAARALGAIEASWCEASGDFTDQGREQFRAATHYVPVTNSDGATLKTYGLLMVSSRPIDQREVMQALGPRLPAVNVSGNGASTPYVPVGWLIAGWVLASLVLSAAVVREIGDRALAALRADAATRALDLSDQEQRSVHRWAILTPVVVALPVGYTAAMVFALYGSYLGFTLFYLERITAVSLAVALTTFLTLLAVFEIHRRTLTWDE